VTGREALPSAGTASLNTTVWYSASQVKQLLKNINVIEVIQSGNRKVGDIRMKEKKRDK
jgi:hypothetical protein